MNDPKPKIRNKKSRKDALPGESRQRQISRAARRELADEEALIKAKRETELLSQSDLAGEISILRVAMRRIFRLASQYGNDLEDLEEEGLLAEDGLDAQFSFDFIKDSGGEAASESDEQPSLKLWIQVLESLSQGAMRLANLMRAQQVLKAPQGTETVQGIGNDIKSKTDQIRKEQNEGSK